jgi:F0F1-type ATP synthase membrane subunit b/b'
VGIFRSGPIIQAASHSLAERFNTAQALHGSAVTIFHDVAAQLTEAEGHYRDVVAEADEEINRLRLIREEADKSAVSAKTSTLAILNLARGINSND